MTARTNTQLLIPINFALLFIGFDRLGMPPVGPHMDSYIEAMKRSLPPGVPMPPLTPGHPLLAGLPHNPNHAALASLYGPAAAAEMLARERDRQTLERKNLHLLLFLMMTSQWMCIL